MSRLKERKIIATLAAFIGGGWLTYEVVHWVLVDHYHLPNILKDVTIVTFLGALLSTVTWRWFRGAEKRSGNVKVEVLAAPLIILLTLAIDLKLIFVMTGVSIDVLLIGIVALCLGISWVVFKSLQWASNVPEAEKKVEVIKPTEEKPISFPEWENSIAVLPFTNMSADSEQEYFCDGMAEEIINALTHIESLRVIARTSAFAFKGKHEDIREIGRKLDVDTLLEGSVRKAGNRLRITAELVNAADGSHLWSERYDRDLEDVFNIQDEISMAIVENLKVKLLKREKAAIIKRPTDDLEAYQLYIKGRFFTNQQFTDESFSKAIDCFKEAIKRDPSFALAYTGITDSNVWLCIGAGVSPSKNAKQEAREAALKAIELDSDLAEAYASLGMFKTVFDWDRVVAGKSFKRALELSPNSSDVLMWYAQYLVILELQYEKAIELFKRALELNPLQLLIYTLLSNAYSFIPQFDRGIQEAQKLLSLDPNHYFGYHILGENYLGKRLYKRAIANYEQAIRLGGRSITNIGELGFAHALAGNTNKAMELLKETEEAVCQSNLYYAWVGLIYVGLGQNDKAFEWFEKAYEEHDPFLIYIPSKKWPKLEDFRRDPRFKALLKKMGVAHLA